MYITSDVSFYITKNKRIHSLQLTQRPSNAHESQYTGLQTEILETVGNEYGQASGGDQNQNKEQESFLKATCVTFYIKHGMTLI